MTPTRDPPGLLAALYAAFSLGLFAVLGLGVLLHELRTEFDIILFDTAPAQAYADAQAVAFRAGNALVVARKDTTRLADTKAVIRELGDMGAHIVGTVFNSF